MPILSPTPPESHGWAPTSWSLLSNLRDYKDPQWQESWGTLAEGYRAPMELYVRRLLARSPGGRAAAQDAPDVVQDFMTQCVEKAWLSRADPEKGKFRAYVQILLRRYVTGWLRRKLARKRTPGEGQQVVPLLPDDEDPDLPQVAPDDAEDFDRSWTQVAVQRALARLAEENERYHTVLIDLVTTEGEGSADLADRVDVRPQQLPVLKHRARRRFAKLFEEELRATVSDEASFADEWRALQPYMP